MNRIEFNHMHRIHKQIWWQVERAFKEWSQFSGVVGKSHDLLMEQMRSIKLKRIALDNLVLCGELSKEECVELKKRIVVRVVWFHHGMRHCMIVGVPCVQLKSGGKILNVYSIINWLKI